MIDDFSPHLAGEIPVLDLTDVQIRISEQPRTVCFHRTHMVGVLMGDKDMMYRLRINPKPAHFFGNDNCYLLSEVPAEKLYQMPCRVLMVTLPESPEQSRPAVTSAMLEEAAGQQDIPKGCALLIGTGWGVHWRREDYLEKSPYFTYDAMHWLIKKKPFLLGSDFPRWENLERPQNFFSEFYRANILMLAPLINLEKLKSNNVLLTALPLKVPGTSCAPCRAVAVETEDII